MKNLALSLTSLFFLITACQTPEETIPQPVNKEQAKEEVKATMGRFHRAVMDENAEAMDSVLATKGLFCGISTGELMDIETMIWSIKEAAKREEVHHDYNIDMQKILVTDDAQSAFVVEHMIMSSISPIPIRQVSHLVKTNNGWEIDFADIGLNPPSGDLHLFNAVSPIYKADPAKVGKETTW